MTAPASLHRSWAIDLDPATMYKILKLRVDVFVVEQSCPYPELDGLDLHQDTRHLWLQDGDDIVCTLRLLEEHEGGKSFRIGRLCTERAHRGKGHTTRLLQTALAEIGSDPCRIDAQTYLVDMYAKHGFTVDGPEQLLDGIAHVPMIRAAGKPWRA